MRDRKDYDKGGHDNKKKSDYQRTNRKFDGDKGRFNKDDKKKSFGKDNERQIHDNKRTYGKSKEGDNPDARNQYNRPYSKFRSSDKTNKPHNRRSFDKEVNSEDSGDKKPIKKTYPSSRGTLRNNKPHNRRSFDNLNESQEESRKYSGSENRKSTSSGYKKRNEVGYEGRKSGFKKTSYGKGTYKKKEKEEKSDWPMRLNRYIAQSGICARREADVLISQGLVKVNGQVITEMGFKVKEQDEVKYDGRKIYPEKKVYLLLNKPKDFITTTDDDRGRKTVMELVSGVTKERMYPVGRLDRNTTGLLLLTNDGDLAQKLTHPSFEIAKVYHATLDKKPLKEDLDKLLSGVQLDDGLAFVDSIVYLNQDDKREIGVSIHSGKNRIVRRIFEAVGYEVIRLDRVLFGPFDKKKIKRGEYRMLKPREIERLVKAKRNI